MRGYLSTLSFFWLGERTAPAKKFVVDSWKDCTRDLLVHQFGWTSDFKGFVSTVPMYWAEHVSSEGIRVHPLNIIRSSREWYMLVAQGNQARNLTFLNYRKKTSGMLNLVTPSSPEMMYRAQIINNSEKGADELFEGDWDIGNVEQIDQFVLHDGEIQRAPPMRVLDDFEDDPLRSSNSSMSGLGVVVTRNTTLMSPGGGNVIDVRSFPQTSVTTTTNTVVSDNWGDVAPSTIDIW